jgi:hypothetical protein
MTLRTNTYDELRGTDDATEGAVAEITDAKIREIFLANGFEIKDGQENLQPYVYAATRALLEFFRQTVPAPPVFLPRSDSLEAKQEIEKISAERSWPCNPTACARIGFEAANRMLDRGQFYRERPQKPPLF